MTRTARDVARRSLRRVARDQAFVSLALAAELDAAGLSHRDGRLATELVYGVCRHQSRLDRALAAKTKRGLGKVNTSMLTILRVAAYQLLFLDRAPDHAAVSDAASAARRLGGARLAGFANGVLRRLAREGEPPLPPTRDARAHIEAACSLPSWISGRLERLFPDPEELLRAAVALSQPAGLAIRAGQNPGHSQGQGDNHRDTQLAALRERLAEDHPGTTVAASELCPGALVLSGLGDPERSSSFGEGLWTVQDIGAQLVSHFLALPRSSPDAPVRILDACAGVGGKSAHLCELYGEGARIDAADLSQRKLDRLAETAKRLGVAGQIAYHSLDLTSAEALSEAGLAESYDAVLIDAPCTGLGVLRRHPETKHRVIEDDIRRMAELQGQLLEALWPRVRPGGVLLYSICTFTREEGSDQIDSFLARHPELRLAPPDDTATRQLSGSAVPWRRLCPTPGILTTWPHRHGADGFFAARMIRA